MNSLFIFRLDLRLKDNIGLIECVKNSKNVYISFIFEPKQIDKSKNDYFSDNCVQFMVESLRELHSSSSNKLMFFYGDTLMVVESLIKKLQLNNVYLNRDYTPFSIDRDSNIEKICNKSNCKLNSFDDILLNSIDKPMKDDGEPYSTFTHYLNKAVKLDVIKLYN